MPGQPRAGEPATIEQARAQVEASRARISETLDEIEERLVEKRVELREKLDVKKRVLDEVEAKPLRTVAIAAGVGFLVGMIGRRRRRERIDEVDREELRELLRDAREQGDDDVHPVTIGRPHPSFWQEARAQLVGALTAALVAAVTEKLRPREVRSEEAKQAPVPDPYAYAYDEDYDEEDEQPRPRRRWPAADEIE